MPNREHVETTVNANEKMDENAGTAEVEKNAARYPTRTRNKPRYLDQPIIDDNVNRTVDYCFMTVDIPKCYKQAIKSPEANKWQNAMDAEVSALNDNNTFEHRFELVPPPKDRLIVGGRWVYAVKIGQNGEETHKARYVAKGYSQIPEIDYQERFAPSAPDSSHELNSYIVGRRMSIQKMLRKRIPLHPSCNYVIFA